ncbi:microtubule-destabilizing protein 60 isoform X3 [Cryptomeria japonica]|uniref:microtubule-destabilizing protein 60 isoform X3 n=1 Tax=Cryptomeria japonica TaxID=3369 RepID=UPI0025AD2226|nr:microtubule-destabilizing protein 60 isoform X3 [Cryptomeria japonica]
MALALGMEENCDPNSNCKTFSLSLYQHSHITHNANAPKCTVPNSTKGFESSSSVSESSEGNESTSSGKRVRRRWVFPSQINQYSSCESTEASRKGVWQKKLNFRERGEKRVVKLTSVKPFELKTQERGRLKEQEFMKKILPRPPTREKTQPLDVKLHTETRAIQRAQFDQLIAEKCYFLEQQRLEEERIQKVLEIEEVKRMRQEMIPRAQMMPFFDQPFVPRRSTMPLTIPKEPNFHTSLRKRANWGLCM